MISIRNAANERRVGELVLTETHFSIRVGGDTWGAGIAYRAPRSVSHAGRRVPIHDYVLLARLALLALLMSMAMRRTSK